MEFTLVVLCCSCPCSESCILADEMGLGKTIQTVGFLSQVRVRHSAASCHTCNLGPLLKTPESSLLLNRSSHSISV